MKSRIAANTFYNLAGSILPVGVSLVTVPLYISLIGEARYGVLLIVWLLVGYFGVLDLGLSRATTNQLARLHDASSEEREGVFWTALTMNGALGLLGALCMLVAGRFLLTHYFKMPDGLRAETLGAISWVAVAVPLSMLTGVLTGTLESCGRFFEINVIQLLSATAYQVGPLAVAFLHGPDLSRLIPTAVLIRVAVFVPLLIVALRSVPLRHGARVKRRVARRLFAYGGWVTVTNVVGAALASADQFLVGSVIGARGVAFYNVPFNLAWRLTMFPISLVRTLFPELSKGSGTSTLSLASRSVRLVGAGFVVIIVAAMLCLKPFLTLWVGKEFSEHASPVGLIFLIGIWVNAVAYVPFALVQAQGRPDLAAKVHLLELLPFGLSLWVGMRVLGVEGGALAWTLRVLADTVVFIWLARIGISYVVDLWPAVGFLVAAWMVATWVHYDSVSYVVAGVAIVASATLWASWREPEALAMIRRLLARSSKTEVGAS